MRDGTRTGRDQLLGALLRELDVPEHRPEFYAELHYRLAEERSARGAAERRRRLSLRRRRRWALRTAFAGGAAAAAALAAGLPWSGGGPEPATAAQIKAKVAAALSSAQTVGGELVVRGESYRNSYGWERRRWQFALTAQGDFRFRHVGGSSDLAFDATEGVERSVGSVSGEGGALERTGVAPGPPDRGPSEPFLQQDFAALVRALLAAEDPMVEETTYEGRGAWRLVIAAEPNAIVPELSGDEFEITVDEETGFPLRVVERKGGTVLDEIRIEELAVDPELTPDDFRIRFPQGMPVERADSGFRRLDLAEVEGAVGYAPLAPERVPEGYELVEVAVATKTLQTGPEGGNPESRDVVSLRYARGLDGFVVTTRLRHVPGYQDIWDDPLATGEGFRDRPEIVRLVDGALAGIEANLLIAPRNTPHIWAKTDKLVVTIAGDLSGAELVAVAESLQRQ